MAEKVNSGAVNTDAMHPINAILREDGCLVVVWREPSRAVYASSPPRPVPDRILKQVYRAEEGRIVLYETVEGRHIPAQIIPEAIEY